MQLVDVLRVSVYLADRLDPASDEYVALARLDRGEGHPDRLEAGGAEPVHGSAGHVVREAGEQRSTPAEVPPLLLLVEDTAGHDVDDLTGIDLRCLLHDRLQGERQEVVGSHVYQRALLGSSDRRPCDRGDNGFRHGWLLSKDVEPSLNP